MKLVFATHNENKIKEVRDLISNKFEILSLDEIGFKDEIIENKNTIRENSIEKVKVIKNITGFDCFADDTGLEVDALGGKPGVLSKRFAGINASSEDNIKKLLKLMESEENRIAQFKTIISLNLNGKIRTFEGICKGLISRKKTGIYGFGYDPVFIPKDKNSSFAEMSLSEKNQIAHRSIAIKKLIDYLKNI